MNTKIKLSNGFVTVSILKPENVEICECGEKVKYTLRGMPQITTIEQDQEGQPYFLYYLPDGKHDTFYFDAITENN